MATDEEKELWKTGPDAAYAEAKRRIEEARAKGAQILNLGDGYLKALQTVPPGIASLANLQILLLNNTQVSDITPIAKLDKLQTLFLNNTQVSDITPIAKLDNLQTLDLDNTQVSDLMPIRGLSALVEAVREESEPVLFTGLSYANTPVANRPIFRDLVELDEPARTIQTLQYLNGEHPEHGGPPSETTAPRGNRPALLANPPADIVTRRDKIDLDPAPPGDAPDDAMDRELATLPRRQQNLADQVRTSLGQNQPTTQTALAQYRDELGRPQSEIILELLKEAYLTAKAGMEQAQREGALDDDAIRAWEQFDANHGVYLAHYPYDTERERLYRNAPVDMDKADPAAVAQAFKDFLDVLRQETVAEIVGDRLQDWAENSTRLSQIITDMAQNAAARGDIPDEDMPHRVWLRRQVAQGWVMGEKLKEKLKNPGEWADSEKGKSAIHKAGALMILYTAAKELALILGALLK